MPMPQVGRSVCIVPVLGDLQLAAAIGLADVWRLDPLASMIGRLLLSLVIYRIFCCVHACISGRWRDEIIRATATMVSAASRTCGGGA